MKAIDYVNKYKYRFVNCKSDEQCVCITGDVMSDYHKDFFEICEQRKAVTYKSQYAILKELDQKWNSMVRQLSEYGAEYVPIRNLVTLTFKEAEKALRGG